MAYFANSQSAGGFWDENPGSRTISVTVTYVEGGGGSKSIKGTVVQPSGDIDIIGTGTPGLTVTGGDTRLGASTEYASGVNGVDWMASIAPASTAGRNGYYGVIQTVDPLLVQRSYTWLGWTYIEQMGVQVVNGVKTQPRPLLDDVGTSPYYLYAGADGNGGLRTFSATASAAANSFVSNDSPAVLLDSGYPTTTFNASFKMTLVFKADEGGIWVPGGTRTWTITLSASYASGTGWTPTTSPTTTGSYSATTSYPQWNAMATPLHNWVQMVP